MTLLINFTVYLLIDPPIVLRAAHKIFGLCLNQASAITILEMKDKIVKLTKEVEQFQDKVTYRVNVLAKLRKGNAASIKEHIIIAEATAKCVGVLKDKKVLALHNIRYTFLLGRPAND